MVSEENSTTQVYPSMLASSRTHDPGFATDVDSAPNGFPGHEDGHRTSV